MWRKNSCSFFLKLNSSPITIGHYYFFKKEYPVKYRAHSRIGEKWQNSESHCQKVNISISNYEKTILTFKKENEKQHQKKEKQRKEYHTI